VAKAAGVWGMTMSDDYTADASVDVFQLKARGLQHNGLRQANVGVVLNIVGFNPGLSNAEISRMSGLAPQTVSAILSALESDGLIMRGEALRGRRGQPALPIYLRADGGFSMGIEIGRRHADVVIINFHAEVAAQYRVEYAFPDPRTIFDDLAGRAHDLMAQLPAEHLARLLDVGVAVPGRMSEGLERSGVSADLVALWSEIDPGAGFERRLRLPVSVYKDGNAGCWSELIALAPPRPGSFIYLLVSTYVAAGIFGDGHLWDGPTSNSADLAAMLVQVDSGDPRTGHAIASLTALEKRLKAAGFAVDLAEADSWDLYAMKGEVEAWLDDAARALALVVFNTLRVVDARLVVLDSTLSAVSERLVQRLRHELDLLQRDGAPTPKVQQGQLGRLAPAIGAAELPLYRRYFSGVHLMDRPR
jgi:predicted NBD/HSP70 family sugar kinase